MDRYAQTSESRTAFRAKLCSLHMRTITATEKMTTEDASTIPAGHDRRTDVVEMAI